LYDLAADPGQDRPLTNSPHQARLEKVMVGLMAANEAPPEAFERLDLEPPSGHAAAKPVKEGAR
jgi:hypothetical protein